MQLQRTRQQNSLINTEPGLACWAYERVAASLGETDFISDLTTLFFFSIYFEIISNLKKIHRKLPEERALMLTC